MANPAPFSRYEFMIAWRYLRPRKKEAAVSIVTIISLVGVTLGVAALIISAHGDRMAPDDVAERLGESATEIPCPDDEGSVRCVGDDQRNGIFGEGVVNADRAVR